MKSFIIISDFFNFKKFPLRKKQHLRGNEFFVHCSRKTIFFRFFIWNLESISGSHEFFGGVRYLGTLLKKIISVLCILFLPLVKSLMSYYINCVHLVTAFVFYWIKDCILYLCIRAHAYAMKRYDNYML